VKGYPLRFPKGGKHARGKGGDSADGKAKKGDGPAVGGPEILREKEGQGGKSVVYLQEKRIRPAGRVESP